MGRTARITRDGLLNVAEDIVRSRGGAALTIGALAQAAGVSKGGVQYSFASKDAIVRALIDRWTAQFDELLGDPPPEDPVRFVQRYIAATRASQQALNAKMAALLVSYLEDPANLRETRDWYRGVSARLSGDGPEARAARVAFLAVEGLFLMRINGLDDENSWAELLDDVEEILQTLVGTPEW